jgi:diguanylate cyclase (GGDEF)-like protein/PAS domain S-box-containing protein
MPTVSRLPSGSSLDELQRLERDNARLRAIADHLPALVACVDLSHRVTFANRAFREAHGAAGEPVGSHLSDVLGDLEYLRRREPLAQAAAGRQVRFEAAFAGADGNRIHSTVVLPEQSAAGRVTGLLTLATDITELREAERRMAALALTDALTGLPNRRKLDDRLPEAVARARRHGAGLAVALLDVDHFKRVNDTHGHATGDLVLEAFARCLRAAVRETDFVARLAGDEFVAVFEDLHRAEESDEIAAKVVAAVRRLQVDASGAKLSCTTSMGIAFLPARQRCAAPVLLAKADEALYATKQRGRDGYTRTVVEADRPANRLHTAG